MTITNDKDFKVKLAALPVARQRHVAAAFVRRVFDLSRDVRVRAALDVAQHDQATDMELTGAYQAANSARVESFTQCGKETDWSAQAGHFVAKAAVACVRPAGGGDSLAWEAAMQARMARTCETVATGEGTENDEAAEQYRILTAFLNS